MCDQSIQRAVELFKRLQEGEPATAPEFFPLVYDELRRVAGKYLDAERADHTLQPTALVHETYLRLARGTRHGFADRAHFFSVAANAMRHILVDHARARAADKRGANPQRETLCGVDEDARTEFDVLDLEAALSRLAELHPRPSRVAELRFFAGLEVEEVALVLSVSARTIKSDWRFARAWLRRALDEGSSA